MQNTQSNTGINVNTSERPNNENDQIRKPNFLFSVDYILNKAGDTNIEDNNNYYTNQQTGQKYDWLYCTRFKPPKLDRNKKKDGQVRQKRRPGRNPRIPFTAHQVTILEAEFGRSAYLGGTNDVHVLSEKLRLSESRIKIWFQNRRARERRDHHNGSLQEPSSTNTSVRQQQLPISSTSAFEPLPRPLVWKEKIHSPLC